MPTAEQFIATRLHQALDHHERAGFGTFTAAGLAVGGPTGPDIVLTVEDVARIAAAVADIHS
jgi:hypothetical protein